jgi:hypothetical protein
MIIAYLCDAIAGSSTLLLLAALSILKDGESIHELTLPLIYLMVIMLIP